MHFFWVFFKLSEQPWLTVISFCCSLSLSLSRPPLHCDPVTLWHRKLCLSLSVCLFACHRLFIYSAKQNKNWRIADTKTLWTRELSNYSHFWKKFERAMQCVLQYRKQKQKKNKVECRWVEEDMVCNRGMLILRLFRARMVGMMEERWSGSVQMMGSDWLISRWNSEWVWERKRSVDVSG